ncbi:hypothetical protein [Pyruvatibacter mobilis]|uniref:hypothetical protein n=1 Tax=Pyruvatibacter mobilis TaxID=1712261 RepID=UPI003D0FD5C0
MTVENLQGRVFEPVGRCIYCGDGRQLGSEHIIPFSLGGNAELPLASCRKCEGVTSYLDGYLARSIFRDHRIHSGIQTRNTYPEKLPAKLEVNGEKLEQDFPISYHPHFTVLPVFARAGVLEGREPGAIPPWKAAAFYDYPDELLHQFRTMGIDQFNLQQSGVINLSTFCRAIAKIAYCNWVAVKGIETLRHLQLIPLILGSYPYATDLVGCLGGQLPPPVEGSLHTISFREETRGQLKLVTALIRLFANRGIRGENGRDDEGFPVYEVVLGAYPIRREQQML